jgi:ribosomal protein S27E
MRSRGLQVVRLSDEFGQYQLRLKCRSCGHERVAFPNTFANLYGWDAKLEDLVARLRCSKCGRRNCVAHVMALQKPRGLGPSH